MIEWTKTFLTPSFENHSNGLKNLPIQQERWLRVSMDATSMLLFSLMMAMTKNTSCKLLTTLLDTLEFTSIKKEWSGKIIMRWYLISSLMNKASEKKFSTRFWCQINMIRLDLLVIVIKSLAGSVFLSLLKKSFQSQMYNLCNIQIKRTSIWFKTQLRSRLNSQAYLMNFNVNLWRTINSAVMMKLIVRNTDLLKMT